MIEDFHPSGDMDAFERAWTSRGEQDLSTLTQAVTHGDTNRILRFMKDQQMSPVSSVGTYLAQVDAPLLAEQLHTNIPDVDAGVVRDWYAYPAAFVLHATPSLAQRELFESVPIADASHRDLARPFQLATKYAGDPTDTTSPLQRVRQFLQTDPTGKKAIGYVATDEALVRARSLSEEHPAVVQSLVLLGAKRYDALMNRVLQELDPREYPGAADRPELSPEEVRAGKQQIIRTIWETELHPYLKVQQEHSFDPRHIKTVYTSLLQGEHPSSAVYQGLIAEMDEVVEYCEDSVALSFPKDLIPEQFLLPTLTLLEAHAQETDEEIAQLYRFSLFKQQGLTDLTEGVPSQIDRGVKQHIHAVHMMQELIKKDRSGFAALHEYGSNPDLIAQRRVDKAHPDVAEAVLQEGINRYTQWYLYLAGKRLAPYPRSQTPYFPR